MRAYTSVFDTTTLTFNRKAEGEGYLDINNNYIEPEGEDIVAIGDLQSHATSQYMQSPIAEGFTLNGSKIFSTKTELRTIDDYSATSADSTLIRGRRYFVSSIAWEGGDVLSTNYNEYILVLQELPNDGGSI